jgi:hypothetical protein
MGKGSTRRPMNITEEQWGKNHERIFKPVSQFENRKQRETLGEFIADMAPAKEEEK